MVTTFPFLWDTLIGHVFIDVFGSPMVAGVFTLLFFYIFGLALRLTLEVQILMMFFVAVLIGSIFISWLPIALMMIVGLFVGLFVIRTLMNM